MDQMTGFASALGRLESALDRLEHVAMRDGGGGELEALRERHRRLKQSAERAVADLDVLIAAGKS